MKKYIIILAKVIGGISGAVVLYCALALVLPYIAIPKEKVNDPASINIYIITNGMHTDIVLPIKNEITDWNEFIAPGQTLSQRTDYNYLAVGWGDKGFYLDTPTWAELQPSVAVKAAFWMSESAMHCTYYKVISESEDCKKISLTNEQYKRLTQYVKDKFDPNKDGKPILIKTDAVYGENDAFFEGQGSYSFLNTCNTWTNNGLKVAGQKAALWTATDFGIFQHYP